MMVCTGFKESNIFRLIGIKLSFWAVREASNSVCKTDLRSPESSDREIVTINLLAGLANEGPSGRVFSGVTVFVSSGGLSNKEEAAPYLRAIRGNTGVDVGTEGAARARIHNAR